MVDTYIKTLKLIYTIAHILLFATFVDFELLVKDIVIKEVSKSSKGSNVKFCSIGSCHNDTCAFIKFYYTLLWTVWNRYIQIYVMIQTIPFVGNLHDLLRKEPQRLNDILYLADIHNEESWYVCIMQHIILIKNFAAAIHVSCKIPVNLIVIFRILKKSLKRNVFSLSQI